MSGKLHSLWNGVFLNTNPEKVLSLGKPFTSTAGKISPSNYWKSATRKNTSTSAKCFGLPFSTAKLRTVTIAPTAATVRPTGCSCSDETRARISAAGKGVSKSLEHRAKIAASERGKKQTPETKAKLSEKRRGETPYKNLLAEISSKRITYATLAKLLGLGHQTFSDKMRDKQRFTTEQIAKLVEYFGKPAEYLMARDDGLAATKTEEERCAKISSTLRQNSPYKNLLIEMDKHQMTYNQLANLMGLLSSASISMKMHSKQNFTPAQIAKLVEIFQKPAEYLLARD